MVFRASCRKKERDGALSCGHPQLCKNGGELVNKLIFYRVPTKYSKKDPRKNWLKAINFIEHAFKLDFR